MLQIIFWASIGVVFYTYFGYPLLISLLAKIRPAGSLAPSSRTSHAPRITLIIPAYNEGRWIERKIRNTLALEYPRDRMQILVASDGSTDRTVEIASRFSSENVDVAQYSEHAGKMATLNRAVAQAGGEILVVTDANALLDPDAMQWLVPHFEDPNVGCVSGNRTCLPTGSPAARGEGLYWRYEAWIKRSENRYRSCLGAYGQLYAVRRSLFPFIPGTSDDFYVPMSILISTGARTVFEPRAMARIPAAATLSQEFRRKVRTHAALLWELPRLSQGLKPWRTKVWWQFWSHHVLRLLVPWAMLMALGTSAYLRDWGVAYRAAAWAQALFYAAAIVGAFVTSRKRAWKLPYACWYFTMANAAVAIGWVRWLQGKRPHVWTKTDRALPGLALRSDAGNQRAGDSAGHKPVTSP